MTFAFKIQQFKTNLFLLLLMLQFILMISHKCNSLKDRRKLIINDLQSTIKNINLRNKTISLSYTQNQTNNNYIIQNIRTSQLQHKNISATCENQQESCGNTFDKYYSIQQKLGEGAHGVVKKCINKKNGKPYAVKILKMQDQHFWGLKNNFLNMKKLKHQSIIKYKALYLNSKKRICYLVMQCFQFPYLKYPIEQETLKIIFRKVLEGLSYSHINNICHRDIKPENILFDQAKGIVKIVDFGISKNMKHRGRYEEMLTQTGTQYYKAPEMFEGGGYTEKVDSWAVGVTIYEMVVGVTPFASEYHSQTINNIISKQVTIQDPKLSKCSILLKDIIVRLLKKNPKQRLSCIEAKDHIWFIPPIHLLTFMKSEQNLEHLPRFSSDTSIIFQNNLTKKNSLDQLNSKNIKMTESQKQNIKIWLNLVGQYDGKICDQYEFKLIEEESIEEKINLPTKISEVSSTSIENLEKLFKNDL